MYEFVVKSLVSLKELFLDFNLVDDITVFEQNIGLQDSGDQIKIYRNCLDTSKGSKALIIIEKLIALGVKVGYESPKNSDCP